jgi:hypothetical protein
MPIMAETIAHEILLSNKRRKLAKNSKKIPLRTKYLWAKAIIYDDEDEKCPVIEG